jgi:hypothetical protein
VNLKFYSYRFAEEVLASDPFRPIRDDILTILQNSPVPRLPEPKIRNRSGKTYVFTVDQGALNEHLDSEFKKRGWELQPWIVGDKGTQLKADYKKGRVQIEAQFGNMARVIYDLFKLQVSYSQDLIDLGIIVVAIQSLARQIDENIAHFERLVRELRYAKMSITLPIWVIGVSE